MEVLVGENARRQSYRIRRSGLLRTRNPAYITTLEQTSVEFRAEIEDGAKISLAGGEILVPI